MPSALNPHPNAHPSAGAFTNAFAIAAVLEGEGERVRAKSRAVTRHHAMLLQTRIQANASGRPGPRAPTGDYRRSWSTTHYGDVSIVGTNKPQARRLEFGFVGPDRIGRVYNQPPFPHVGPAVDLTMPGYADAIAQLPSLGGS